MLGGVALFQALLAFGFPYGKAAWGGLHPGVLPRNLRIGSAITSLFFIFSILVVLSKARILVLFPASFENGLLWFLTLYFFIGIIMNAISRSKLERWWAPYVAVLFILSLRLLL